MSVAQPARYPGPPDEPEESAVTTLTRITRIVVWVLYALVVINAVILVMAFVLRLLGANPDADFTQWVYRSADRSMGPFRGIFPARQVSDDSVFDSSLLFAAVMYVIAAVLIDSVLHWLKARLAPTRTPTPRPRQPGPPYPPPHQTY